MNDALVRAVELQPPVAGEIRTGYPWNLPVVRGLADGLALNPAVTYLIGENGSGKSTVLEALAASAGMNPEGGSSNFTFSTRESHSGLWEAIRLIRGARRPRTDFFLRAESLFTTATYVEELGERALTSYGGRSLHEQSHGEAFLAVMLNRFGPDGFYVLDEPEAALSTQNCLAFLRRVHELVGQGSQFVIATHSPIVLAYPGATILACTDDGLHESAYDDAEPVRLTRGFLDSPGAFLRALLED